MQVIATKSNTHYNTRADEFVAWNKLSPWEDFFVNPFDVISPNQLCNCTLMYVYRYRCWSKHMQWNNEEILLQRSIIVSLTPDVY